MSEITYQTTTGRYGAAKPDHPVVPSVEADYVVTLESSAAADGILFWFWRLEKLDPPPVQIVHGMKGGFALCGEGPPSEWAAGEKWSSEAGEITCVGCLTHVVPEPESTP